MQKDLWLDTRNQESVSDSGGPHSTHNNHTLVGSDFWNSKKRLSKQNDQVKIDQKTMTLSWHNVRALHREHNGIVFPVCAASTCKSVCGSTPKLGLKV